MQLHDPFIHRSAHFGNLFVTIHNAELSNKMAKYKTDQKVFVIKTFYSFDSSCVAVERELRREFSVRAAPSKDVQDTRTVLQ
jgi:hypothetical protein